MFKYFILFTLFCFFSYAYGDCLLEENHWECVFNVNDMNYSLFMYFDDDHAVHTFVRETDSEKHQSCRAYESFTTFDVETQTISLNMLRDDDDDQVRKDKLDKNRVDEDKDNLEFEFCPEFGILLTDVEGLMYQVECEPFEAKFKGIDVVCSPRDLKDISKRKELKEMKKVQRLERKNEFMRRGIRKKHEEL
eukprot:TRINITY_DN481_c0_g4_i1.p1 TRINITY_DN481_c0_g4~~TRINITY_DN481_c0_g4_i1.p1  ORF type:complete len:192 (+),score=60.29 TRINITY_DN481_c0_g4_i1:109-684(+)